jgi:hypothetical protein
MSKEPATRLRRFDLGVDLSSYPTAQFVPGGFVFVPKDLPRQVLKNGVIDEVYWYYDERGAADYLTLLQSQDYRVLNESKRLLDTCRSDIFNRIHQYLKVSTEAPQPMDLVALGVGSADKELSILNSWLEYYPRHFKKAMGYVPVDISFPLLQNSLRAVFSDSKLRDRITRGQLDIKPVLADFRLLSIADLGNFKLKVLASLGTVWNCDVKNVFESLKKVVTAIEEAGNTCFLLVDAEFIGNRTNDELKISYDNEELRSLLFHPLEILSAAAQDKYAIMHYEEGGTDHQIRFAEFFADYTKEQGKVFVDVVSNENLDKFINDYEFDEVMAKRYLLGGGSLEKSRTVAIIYVPNEWKKGKRRWPRPVLLGYSTRFEFKEFDSFLSRSGFKIMKAYYNSEGTFGYFLLRVATNGSTVSEQISPNLQDVLTRLSRQRAFTPLYKQKVDDIEFDAILEGRRSKIPFGHPPIALIRMLKSTEGVAGIENEIEKLSKDCKSALSVFASIKGAVLWVPSDTRYDLLKSLEEKYQDNKFKLKIIRNEEEFRNALSDLGL